MERVPLEENYKFENHVMTIILGLDKLKYDYYGYLRGNKACKLPLEAGLNKLLFDWQKILSHFRLNRTVAKTLRDRHYKMKSNPGDKLFNISYCLAKCSINPSINNLIQIGEEIMVIAITCKLDVNFGELIGYYE